MISDQFGFDEIDRSIITLLQKHPNITHSEIAKRIGRSQPAVGSRIHRLEEKGVISSQYGINFKNADIILAKVELSTKETDRSDKPHIQRLVIVRKNNLPTWRICDAT